MAKKLKGTVIESYYGKSLLCIKNIYYIVKGAYEKGVELEFDPENALAMPSYLFAIAAMNEENLDDTFDFIKTNWFGGMSN